MSNVCVDLDSMHSLQAMKMKEARSPLRLDSEFCRSGLCGRPVLLLELRLLHWDSFSWLLCASQIMKTRDNIGACKTVSSERFARDLGTMIPVSRELVDRTLFVAGCGLG